MQRSEPWEKLANVDKDRFGVQASKPYAFFDNQDNSLILSRGSMQSSWIRGAKQDPDQYQQQLHVSNPYSRQSALNSPNPYLDKIRNSSQLPYENLEDSNMVNGIYV